jgi:hypothetical protein
MLLGPNLRQFRSPWVNQRAEWALAVPCHFEGFRGAPIPFSFPSTGGTVMATLCQYCVAS